MVFFKDECLIYMETNILLDSHGTEYPCLRFEADSLPDLSLNTIVSTVLRWDRMPGSDHMIIRRGLQRPLYILSALISYKTISWDSLLQNQSWPIANLSYICNGQTSPCLLSSYRCY